MTHFSSVLFLFLAVSQFPYSVLPASLRFLLTSFVTRLVLIFFVLVLLIFSHICLLSRFLPIIRNFFLPLFRFSPSLLPCFLIISLSPSSYFFFSWSLSLLLPFVSCLLFLSLLYSALICTFSLLCPLLNFLSILLFYPPAISLFSFIFVFFPPWLFVPASVPITFPVNVVSFFTSLLLSLISFYCILFWFPRYRYRFI